jgi:hypothetical protein
MRRRHTRLPSVPLRAAASLAALLVLVLTVLAASPELHQRLHGHDSVPGAAHAPGAQAGRSHADDADDGCVVTLFAQGLVLSLALWALAFAGRVLRALDPASDDRVSRSAPSFLLLPSQAPPLA